MSDENDPYNRYSFSSSSDIDEDEEEDDEGEDRQEEEDEDELSDDDAIIDISGIEIIDEQQEKGRSRRRRVVKGLRYLDKNTLTALVSRRTKDLIQGTKSILDKANLDEVISASIAKGKFIEQEIAKREIKKVLESKTSQLDRYEIRVTLPGGEEEILTLSDFDETDYFLLL